jgi:LacI family transcriptional regulator
MRSRRYASLTDVAQRAQVSFQTAGKVLNGAEVRVAPETAKRIFAAASELGYHPNALARSLLRQATCTLGLVIGNVTDAALARVAVGVQDEARLRGHAILLASLPSSDTHGAAVVRMLFERRVDGIIVAPPQLEEDFEFVGLLKGTVPAVTLQHVPGGGVPFVGNDDRQAGRIAAQHLIGQGHRYIGTVTGPFRRWIVRSRLLGSQETMRDAGLEMGEDQVVESDWTPAGGAAAARILLEREPRTTAVFVQSDEMAVGVLRELQRLGRRVPDDVAVVGCDDMPFAEHLSPSLSSVHIPFVEVGALAVRVLLDRIAHKQSPSDSRLLPVSLVVRESCGASLVVQSGREDAPGSLEAS